MFLLRVCRICFSRVRGDGGVDSRCGRGISSRRGGVAGVESTVLMVEFVRFVACEGTTRSAQMGVRLSAPSASKDGRGGGGSGGELVEKKGQDELWCAAGGAFIFRDCGVAETA